MLNGHNLFDKIRLKLLDDVYQDQQNISVNLAMFEIFQVVKNTELYNCLQKNRENIQNSCLHI